MAGIKFDFVTMGIGDLLKRGRLEVPPNQRSYAWEERHILTLFQDLNEAISAGNEDYFLGTVVLIQPEKGLPTISDGQQRIATITILLCRIRDRLIGINRGGSAASLDSDFLRNIDRDTEAVVPRLKLNLEDNDFFVRRIIFGPVDAGYADSQAVQPMRSSNERLLKASDLAKQFLEDGLKTVPPQSHADYLLRWVKFIEKSAGVAIVTAQDEAGAFRMFETLNDRGLRASQADILKNYFFSRSADRLKEAWAMWNTITGAIEALDEDDNERLVTFIRHLWITTHGQTRARELAAEIKAEITSEAKTMTFVADAATAIHDYVALWSPRHSKWANYKPAVRQSVETLADHLQVEQIKPLLFAVARYFDPDETEKAFRLFVSWSVRFLIYGGRGGMLDQQYSLRAQDVGTKKITKARELREAMANYVPTDAAFEEAFATARVSRAHFARYYLRALEKSLKADDQPEYVANEEVNEINLEHVLPLNADDGWGVDSDEAKASQRMLGNMVLLRANQNRDLGGKTFDEKKIVYGESGYFITKQVARYDAWGLKEIKERQAELAKIAVKTWRLTFGD
jgi:Protein of unknown function DUF262/Protein of unknown function (DUF1524)